MPTDEKPNEPGLDGAVPVEPVPEAKSPAEDPGKPQPATPDKPMDDGFGQQAKERDAQGRPAYEQRQQARAKAFGSEADNGGCRPRPTREPRLNIDQILLQRVSTSLLKKRILILECIEERILDEIPDHLVKRDEWSRYRSLEQVGQSGRIDQYLGVSGPAIVVLTATPSLLDSFSNRGDLWNFNRIAESLKDRDIVVLVCARFLSDRRLRTDRHLVRFREQANETSYWLLPLLEEAYVKRGGQIFERLAQQREAELWPQNERDFHAEVTLLIEELRLEEELDKRQSTHRSNSLWKNTRLEDIFTDGTKSIETRALFLRAFLSTSSTYVLEKSLEIVLGVESDEWKKYGSERRNILELLQTFEAQRTRVAFESDRWLLVKLTEAVVDRLLPASLNPEVEIDCLELIAAAAITDPQGFGYDVVFRTLGARRDRGVASWDRALAAGKPRTERLRRASSLIGKLLQQSSTLPIVLGTLDQVAEWHRSADVLELVEGLDLSSDLGGKTVCDYYARALNEGSEEVRNAAGTKLRNRAWRSPSELLDVLLSTKAWLPEGDQPSQAATVIAEIVTETLEVRLVRDSKDGAYVPHLRLSNLVASFGDDFISLAVEWMLHPFIRQYICGLLTVHEIFLIDTWIIPAGLRGQVLAKDDGKNFEYVINCFAGLLRGLEAAGTAFGENPPPLFAAMFIAEWALAKGATVSLSRIGKTERRALSACWAVIDRTLESAAATVGRIAGKPRPATDFVRKIRSAVRNLRSSMASPASA